MEKNEKDVKFFGLVNSQRKEALLSAASDLDGLDLGIFDATCQEGQETKSPIIERIVETRMLGKVSTQNETENIEKAEIVRSQVNNQVQRGFLPVEITARNLQTLTEFWRKVGQIGLNQQ